MPMRKTLDTLAETAAKLNSKTDELNQVISDVEHELQDAGLGMTLWLAHLLDASATERRYRPDDDEQRWPISVTQGWQLGFAKIDGQWRLSARYVRSEETADSVDAFEERQPVPLLKAPRLVRVEAAPLLETLVTVLTKRMNVYIRGIEQAKALAKDDELPAFDSGVDDLLLGLIQQSGENLPPGLPWTLSISGLVELVTDAGMRIAHDEAALVLERLERRGELIRDSGDIWKLPNRR